MTFRRFSRATAVAGTLSVIGSIAGTASGTWSIVIVNTRTGEVAAASATCLTGFDLRAETPVVLTGIGAATAQSAVDITSQNRTFIRDRLLESIETDAIITGLSGIDNRHETRQYGIVDTTGRATTFSGADASAWAGGVTGQIGDLVYAVQGNILTGEPVVTEAERAIRETTGDMAEKLMAAMEAAAFFGGDGRCSCDLGPTDCGSPPVDGFEKSADVGYMIIARIGDSDASNAAYRTIGRPFGVDAADFNGDGRLDIVGAPISGSRLSVLMNSTIAERPTSKLDAPADYLAGSGLGDVAAIDIDGDTAPDLVATNAQTNQIAILMNDGRGVFGDPTFIDVGVRPEVVKVADLDGQLGLDLVVLNTGNGSASILFSDGSGGFEPPATVFAGIGPEDVTAGDFNADGLVDLAFANETNNSVGYSLATAPGVWPIFPAFSPVGDDPRGIEAGNFDGLPGDEIAVINRGDRSISVLTWNGSGFDRADVDAEATGQNPTLFDLAIGDLDADGDADLAVLRSGDDNLGIFTNDGTGAFASAGGYRLLLGVNEIGLADLNGDGLPDLYSGSSTASGVLTSDNRGDARFNPIGGTGGGDHFLALNVANTVSADPDPVITLREMFDDWRTGNVGRPDAVRSVVSIDRPALPIGTDAVASIVVGVRDYQGIGVQMPFEVEVSALDGSGTVEAEMLGNGRFRFEVPAGDEADVSSFRVVIDDGVRPVVLMPNPSVRTVESFADVNGDGSVTFFDALMFLQSFSEGSPAADVDGDGDVDQDDATLFFGAFDAG